MRRNTLIRIPATGIIACLFSLITYAGDSTAILQHGIADLRNTNFNNTTVAFKGNCRFAWNKLVEPSSADLLDKELSFPILWNDIQDQTSGVKAQGYASYGFTFLLPHHHPPLAVKMPMVYCSYRLFINGRKVASNGVPAAQKKSYQPSWVPVTVEIPEGTDTVQLIMQVANFSHSKGGVNLSMEIGERSKLFLQKERIISEDFLLAGCLFMGGLFFLALFVIGARDKATLYFSLFCMLYSYRMVGAGAYSLHAAFPSLSWELTVRLEYLSLFGAVYLLLKYIRHLYPNDVHTRMLKLISGICGALFILTVTTSAIFFTGLLHGFLYMTMACMVYLVYVFVKAYQHKRIAAGYALLSVVILLLIAFATELDYFGVMIPSRMLTFIGHVLFFFLQSVILAVRFSHTLKEAKRQAEQGLQAKSEFLSTMSHEIRTPLNSVIGMSNLMQKNNPRPDQKEQLDVLQFSARNLLSIVNDILDYNKIEAGKIVFEKIEMDIREIALNIAAGARVAADEKGVQVKCCIDESITHYVKGDPTRLTQVLHNLVSNAVKFTPEGEVLLDITVMNSTEKNTSILFTVKDTGIGIPEEKQRMVFEQFTQADSSTSRSFGGTGLGLAITKKILALQGSDLQLTSDAGKGTTFYFILTFELAAVLPVKNEYSAETSFPHEHDLSGTHLLLVEDNPINILVAKTFLEKWGVTVEVAQNGEEALGLLDTSRHQMVLMDLHMPVMDGYTAIRNIRKQGISIPIIVLSASMPSEVEAETKGLDINGFVLKPFVPDELFNKVYFFSRDRHQFN